MNLEFPGLIDVQVNGAGGHDLTSAPERLWDVAVELLKYGVTGFLPTLVTSEPEIPARALAVLAAGPPAGWVGAEPLGLHLEGPMLAPSRRGAHATEWLRSPSLDLIDGWSRESGVAMVTIAPELPGALEVVSALVERGVVVSIGHTNANADEMSAALAAGARCITHLGNAMPAMSARDAGPIGAALGGSDLVAGLIVDGYHLDPLFVRTAWRALGPTRLLSVSDTTAALGLADGPTRLGHRDVLVSGGTVRLPDGTLAGSGASLLDCLKVLVNTVGCRVDEAMVTATSVPQALLGLGARDDRIVVTPNLELVATVIGGRVVQGSL